MQIIKLFVYNLATLNDQCAVCKAERKAIIAEIKAKISKKFKAEHGGEEVLQVVYLFSAIYNLFAIIVMHLPLNQHDALVQACISSRRGSLL